MMRSGRFPQSLELGGKVCWYEDEFETWLGSLQRRKLKPLTQAEAAKIGT